MNGDAIAHLPLPHFVADRDDDAGDLMTEGLGQGTELRAAGAVMSVAVADACGADLDENLTGGQPRRGDIVAAQRPPEVQQLHRSHRFYSSLMISRSSCASGCGLLRMRSARSSFARSIVSGDR